MLRRLVAQHGTKKWAHLATIIKSKKSKQVNGKPCCLAGLLAGLRHRHIQPCTYFAQQHNQLFEVVLSSVAEDGRTFRMLS